jgi:hypothetical protein
VITAAVLTADQDYFLAKLKRHNRMLHGWGIVCGADVAIAKDSDNKTLPWFVQVNPGYVLSPCGCEIAIEQAVCIDIRIRCSQTSTAPPNPCLDAVSQAPAANTDGNVTAFIVLRCKETGSRPVRVSVTGCGCGENPCENSRWMDDYEICTLQTLPSTHTKPAPPPPANCLAAPADPWIVLALATAKADGTITLDTTVAEKLPGH